MNNKIERLRIEANISKSVFNELIGDLTNPSIMQLEKFSTLFGISLEDLMEKETFEIDPVLYSFPKDFMSLQSYYEFKKIKNNYLKMKSLEHDKGI